MNKKFLFLIFVLSISVIIAQESVPQKKNGLQFSTGYTIGYLKNLSFAPVSRYDYSALNYQLEYSRTTKREKLFEVDLSYLDSELETNIIPEPNPQYSKLVLNFSLLKEIYKNEKLNIHLGLQTQTNISSFYSWKQYDFQQKFGIAGRINYRLNSKNSIVSKISIPFILGRISTFEEGFYSLSKYQGFIWTTKYNYILSKHFDLIAHYNFNYDRLQISNAFRELQHQINLGINYKF